MAFSLALKVQRELVPPGFLSFLNCGMIMLIQLQRLDENGNNIGGLYLQIDHISAIFIEKTVDRRICKIAMSNGITYDVAQTISEVLDELRRLNT